jgi:molybdopterin-guanine dinucleotide biosynthesis protein A
MTMEPATCLSAAILAGGMSRRMGLDKAMLTLGGMTFLERALAAVEVVADDLMIIGDRPDYHGLGAAVIADSYPGSGPLGGIATALVSARHDHVLVVGCDMPFLSAPLLRAMANQPRGYDALMLVTEPDSRDAGDGPTVHPLHAIYSRRCLSTAVECLEAGRLRVSAMTARIRVRQLPESWVRRYDPRLLSLMNVNDPSQLAIAASAMECLRRNG